MPSDSFSDSLLSSLGSYASQLQQKLREAGDAMLPTIPEGKLEGKLAIPKGIDFRIEESDRDSANQVGEPYSVERYPSGLCFDLNLDHWFDTDSDKFSTTFDGAINSTVNSRRERQ